MLIIVTCFLVCLSMPLAAIGSDTFSSDYIQGRAAIIVDGIGNDWSVVEGNHSLPYIDQIHSKSGGMSGETDVSATYATLMDDEYVYFFVGVHDDQIVFDESPVDIPIWDDCVEVLLGGKDNPSKFWITLQDEKTSVIGRTVEMPDDLHVWEKDGVKAGLSMTSVGYDIELAIPRQLLPAPNTTVLEVNLRVYDDDDGGRFDTLIQSVDETESSFLTLSYDRVLAGDSTPPDIQSGTAQIVLSEPDATAETNDPEIALGVANIYEKANLYGEAIQEYKAVKALTAGTSEFHQRAMLGVARNSFFSDNYTEAVNECNDILSVASDKRILLDARMILLTIQRKQENAK